MRRRRHLAHFGEQKQRIRIADHRVREPVHQPLQSAAVQRRRALLERLKKLVERPASLRIELAGRFDFRAEVALPGIAGRALQRERRRHGWSSGAWRARKRLHLAARRIDEHMPAEFAQRLKLLLGAQAEALEGERRADPRPVELCHVHAELQLADGNGLSVHGSKL